MDSSRQQRERVFWDSFAKKYDPFMRNSRSLYLGIIERVRREMKWPA